ncbi:hypothetical protein CYMTET_8828 [Cymbomonas tetramitiformis]|uniref:WLM domain-containing protein n=1 Tax=Cymbomonas tetramitiformis TaxID=36881 RepID=A0AAE0LFM2_9CHLO|nr:hypothetical protein CYMTET_8828 [Cymbomonas tetramitiformis]
MSEEAIVHVSCKGSSANVTILPSETFQELMADIVEAFALADSTLKVIFKGRQLQPTDVLSEVGVKGGTRILALATPRDDVKMIQGAREDPTIRSFEQEREKQQAQQGIEVTSGSIWGTEQSSRHKFCRYEFCTWQSFGVRPSAKTPHPFEARKLLVNLATDPGIVHIMTSFEWVVTVLAEMDPIDDRVAHKTEQAGSCLLGYNTNMGQRIDLRLRTLDLTGFDEYPNIINTLLHELTHNVFGEHDHQFWALFTQLKVEYLCFHLALRRQGRVSSGRTFSQIAGIDLQLADIKGAARDQLMKDLYRPLTASELAHIERCYATSSVEVGLVTRAPSSQEALTPSELRLKAAESALRRASNSAEADVMPAAHASPNEQTGRVPCRCIHHPAPKTSAEVAAPKTSAEEVAPTTSTEEVEPSNCGAALTSDTTSPPPPTPAKGVREHLASHDGQAPETNARPEARTQPDKAGWEADTAMAGTGQEAVTTANDGRRVEGGVVCHGNENSRRAPHPRDSITFEMKSTDSKDAENTVVEGQGTPEVKEQLQSAIASDADLGDVFEASDHCMNEVVRGVERLLCHTSREQQIVALETLGKILQNVQRFPHDEKFRRIKQDNAAFTRRIGVHDGGIDVLKAAGFREKAGELILTRSDPGLLWLANSVVQTQLSKAKST